MSKSVVFGHGVRNLSSMGFQPVEPPELGTVIVRLENDTKDAVKSQHVKLGNPAAVGLAGFGLTTLALQLHNLEWMGLGPVIWLGLIFGGLAQLVAGLQEFATGNNFGYSAFTTYGAFWIALGLLFIGNHFKIYTASQTDVGCFLLVFTLYTLIMFGATFNINIGLCVVFGLLLIGFICLDISHFTEHGSSVSKGFQKTAGVVLILCALAAWYVMSHVIYHDVYKRDVFPVGPAPMKLIHLAIYPKRHPSRQV